MKPIIKVENLSKQYKLGGEQKPYSTLRESLTDAARKPFKRRGEENIKSFWALQDINFEVEPGDVVGIIGRNGAGKSTLLKILSRITEPTKGKIELYGRVSSLLEVGTGFHPELTGRENVFLNGAILGMRQSEIARKFDEIVDFAEVEEFLDTPVKHYSSGMYTRLAFAVAANLEPEVLIVDEVLAVGDAEFQKKCLGKMKSVSDKEGRTVLFVSHNITAVESLCTRGLFLKNGQLIENGKINSVINTYLSKEVKNKTEREWLDPNSAPGNDSVRLKRVGVIPQLEDGETEIRINTPIDIEFEFWNISPSLQELNLSIVLWTVTGECIFNVVSNLLKASPGVCRGKLKIPANFLNDNNYSVELYIIKDSSVAVFREADIVSFEVHDLQREGNWFGKWIGTVRPKFDFNLSQL